MEKLSICPGRLHIPAEAGKAITNLTGLSNRRVVSIYCFTLAALPFHLFLICSSTRFCCAIIPWARRAAVDIYAIPVNNWLKIMGECDMVVPVVETIPSFTRTGHVPVSFNDHLGVSFKSGPFKT